MERASRVAWPELGLKTHSITSALKDSAYLGNYWAELDWFLVYFTRGSKGGNSFKTMGHFRPIEERPDFISNALGKGFEGFFDFSIGFRGDPHWIFKIEFGIEIPIVVFFNVLFHPDLRTNVVFDTFN
eukprot:scaffold22318_cov62-Cyclotella_meneghiniana.AAC.4